MPKKLNGQPKTSQKRHTQQRAPLQNSFRVRKVTYSANNNIYSKAQTVEKGCSSYAVKNAV